MTAQTDPTPSSDRAPVTERDMLAAMELLATADSDPNELVVLTDEELAGVAGAEALDLLGGPYLAQEGVDPAASTAAAVRSLAARRLLKPRGEDDEREGDTVAGGDASAAPAPFQLDRRLAGVVTLRRIPEAMLIVERTLSGGTTRLGHYLFPAGGVLEEYVTVDGFHHFCVPTLSAVAQRLVRFVDPFEDATTDGAEREVTIPGEEVERTLSDARSVSVLTSIHAGDGRRATFAATPGALYLVDDGDLQTVPTSGTREATMGALSPARLLATLSVLVPVIGADEA